MSLSFLIVKWAGGFLRMQGADALKCFAGFPGGSVIKNLPASAGDMGLILDLGKIPHAEEQLSPCATTIEPVLKSPGEETIEASTLEPVLHKRSHRNEKPVHLN